jgi:hypothetical protein
VRQRGRQPMHFGSTLCRKRKRMGPPGKPAYRFRNSRSQSLGSPNRANAGRDSSTARPDRKSGTHVFRKEKSGRYAQNDNGWGTARLRGRFQREHARCYLISEYKSTAIYLGIHSNEYSASADNIVRTGRAIGRSAQRSLRHGEHEGQVSPKGRWFQRSIRTYTLPNYSVARRVPPRWSRNS